MARSTIEKGAAIRQAAQKTRWRNSPCQAGCETKPSRKECSGLRDALKPPNARERVRDVVAEKQNERAGAGLGMPVPDADAAQDEMIDERATETHRKVVVGRERSREQRANERRRARSGSEEKEKTYFADPTELFAGHVRHQANEACKGMSAEPAAKDEPKPDAPTGVGEWAKETRRRGQAVGARKVPAELDERNVTQRARSGESPGQHTEVGGQIGPDMGNGTGKGREPRNETKELRRS